MLLSGSVHWGVEDLGAVYYNPARLWYNRHSLLLSANVYEVEARSRLMTSSGIQKFLHYYIPGGSHFSGRFFQNKWLPKHYFAYALLTRQNSDFNLSYQNEVYQDVIASLPGNEYFNGAINIQSSSSQQCTSISWAYPVSSKFV